MGEDNLVSFKNPAPETTNDLLTQIARQGAQKMLAAALEAEIEAFIHLHQESTAEGEPRLIRNGFLPKRSVQTGIGSIDVQVPRMRDRSVKDKVQFRSSIIPPYLRCSKSVEEFLRLLYLKRDLDRRF